VCRQDRDVLEPTAAWMVQLELSTDDVEGTLALEEEALRFTTWDEQTRTIPLADVTKVKRIFGSPVLLVHSTEGGRQRHTAFYFRKPPPLQPPEPSIDDAPSLIGPFNRTKPTSKRRQRRANASYLATASTSASEQVRDWLLETRKAVAAAKGR
jgi:hypothetical protein